MGRNRDEYGRFKRGPRPRSQPDAKKPIVGMVERDGDVRAFVTDDVKTRTIQPLVDAHVLPESMVYTDEAQYSLLSRTGYEHRRAAMYTRTRSRGSGACLRTAVYHSVGRATYVNEYAFRYNHRDDDCSAPSRSGSARCVGEARKLLALGSASPRTSLAHKRRFTDAKPAPEHHSPFPTLATLRCVDSCNFHLVATPEGLVTPFANMIERTTSAVCCTGTREAIRLDVARTLRVAAYPSHDHHHHHHRRDADPHVRVRHVYDAAGLAQKCQRSPARSSRRRRCMLGCSTAA